MDMGAGIVEGVRVALRETGAAQRDDLRIVVHEIGMRDAGKAQALPQCKAVASAADQDAQTFRPRPLRQREGG